MAGEEQPLEETGDTLDRVQTPKRPEAVVSVTAAASATFATTLNDGAEQQGQTKPAKKKRRKTTMGDGFPIPKSVVKRTDEPQDKQKDN